MALAMLFEKDIYFFKKIDLQLKAMYLSEFHHYNM